ncbi:MULTISPECIES: hypothetical protein [unclassified Luteococcus]|uniref:hypothetical protein n=1 Tax=unclassified Luteococcus TaxID=2639923 RepID=UPI00313BCAAA
MAETVKRIRETIARVVLAVSVGYILISLVRGGYLLYRQTPLAETARLLGGSSLSIVMVLLVVASGLACVLVRPATARGSKLARMGAVVIGVAALLEALFLVVGMFQTRVSLFVTVLEVLGGVLEIAIKAVAAHVLWRASAATAGAPAVEPVEAKQSQQPVSAAEPAQQASWRADQAAGAVWTRAGDAASGAAASTWGHPGAKSGGWTVPDGPAALEAPAQTAPRGPWATAGDLATGSALPPGQSDADNAAEAARAEQVRWEPVRRPD